MSSKISFLFLLKTLKRKLRNKKIRICGFFYYFTLVGTLFGTSIQAFSNALLNFLAAAFIAHLSMLRVLTHSFIEWTFSPSSPKTFFTTAIFSLLYLGCVNI